MHVNRLILAAFLNGDLPRAVFEEIVRDHLMELCPVCCAEIEAFDWREYRDRLQSPDFYREPFDRVRRRLSGIQSVVERDRREAERWLRELRKLPVRNRRGTVRRAHSRFRGKPFVEAVLDEARSHLPENPAEALSWAEVAHSAFKRTAGLEYPMPLQVLVLAVRGNAYRANGNLVAADLDFAKVRKKIHHEEVLDLDLMAEIDSLEGSLRKDRRELDRAERLLTRAAAFYRLLGEVEHAGRARMKLADVSFYRGDSGRAITQAEQAIEDLRGAKSRDLLLYARFNLATYLEDAGDHSSAEKLLAEDAAAREERFGQLLKLRDKWLAAKIARAKGEEAQAEEQLREVRDGFLAAEIGYDVAMVSLDLSALLHSQGRLAEVKTVACEAFVLFSSQLVSREALAAFKLFVDAARRESVSEALIRDTIQAMRRAPRQPLDIARPS